MWAPAVKLDMINNMATKYNWEKHNRWGDEILHSPIGVLARGLHGTGRMRETGHIHAAMRAMFVEREFRV